MEQVSILSLPTETLQNIGSLMRWSDIISLMRCCKILRDAFTDDLFWKIRIKRLRNRTLFTSLDAALELIDISWKECYKGLRYPTEMSHWMVMLLENLRTTSVELTDTNFIAYLFVELLNLGADIDVVNSKQETLLHLACKLPFDARDILIVLLERGANPTQFDNSRNTPIFSASPAQQFPILHNLFSGQGVNNLLRKLETALMDLNLYVVKECLIVHRINPNIILRGSTALAIALKYLFSGAVEILLQCGADPNFRNKGLVAPLVIAIENGDKKSVDLLLRYGANVWNSSSNVFVKAIEKQDSAILPLLMDTESLNSSQLEYLATTCIKHNALSCLELIVVKPAFPKEALGACLDNAVEKLNMEIVHLLVSTIKFHNIEISKKKQQVISHRVAWNGDALVLNLLYKNWKKFEDWITILTMIVQKNHSHLISFVEDVPITQEALDHALKYAVIHCNRQVMKILLKKGAAVSVLENDPYLDARFMASVILKAQNKVDQIDLVVLKEIEELVAKGFRLDFASKLEMNSIKLFYSIGILGGKGVGKKTLYRLLVSGIFSEATFYSAESNIGISFLYKGFQVNLAFRICDTTGGHSGLQELRGCHGFFILYNMLDEDTRNQVKYWILDITHYFPKMSKLSVIGTKADLTTNKVDLPAFPNMPTFHHSQVSLRNRDKIFADIVVPLVNDIMKADPKAVPPQPPQPPPETTKKQKMFLNKFRS